MQLVADANIVVASILSHGGTRKIVFSKKVELFSPDRLEFEILAHKEEFKQKGLMAETEFQMALRLGLENLTVFVN